MVVTFNRSSRLFFISVYDSYMVVGIMRKFIADVSNISPLIGNIRGSCSVLLSDRFGQGVFLIFRIVLAITSGMV